MVACWWDINSNDSDLSLSSPQSKAWFTFEFISTSTFNSIESLSSTHNNSNYFIQYENTRSLGVPPGPDFLGSGPSGLLDNVLHALWALRPCDPRNGSMIG